MIKSYTVLRGILFLYHTVVIRHYDIINIFIIYKNFHDLKCHDEFITGIGEISQRLVISLAGDFWHLKNFDNTAFTSLQNVTSKMEEIIEKNKTTH